MSGLRVGHGSDVHELRPGNKLVLGGVTIDVELGTVGHSDGDVLIHAFIDSLLGAVGRGDIGEHFPGTGRWNNADSDEMLRHVAERLKRDEVSVLNADLTVYCELIPLANFRESMEENCRSPFVNDPQLNVKYKTCDGFGAVGRSEAIRAKALTLVRLGTGPENS